MQGHITDLTLELLQASWHLDCHTDNGKLMVTLERFTLLCTTILPFQSHQRPEGIFCRLSREINIRELDIANANAEPAQGNKVGCL